MLRSARQVLWLAVGALTIGCFSGQKAAAARLGRRSTPKKTPNHLDVRRPARLMHFIAQAPPVAAAAGLCIDLDLQRECKDAFPCFDDNICGKCGKPGEMPCAGGCQGCVRAVPVCTPCFAEGGPLHGMPPPGGFADTSSMPAVCDRGFCETNCIPYLHCADPETAAPDCAQVPPTADCPEDKCFGCPEVQEAFAKAHAPPGGASMLHHPSGCDCGCHPGTYVSTRQQKEPSAKLEADVYCASDAEGGQDQHCCGHGGPQELTITHEFLAGGCEREYCEPTCMPFLHCVNALTHTEVCEKTPQDCMPRCGGCPEVFEALHAKCDRAYCEPECMKFVHCANPLTDAPDCVLAPEDCGARCGACPEVAGAVAIVEANARAEAVKVEQEKATEAQAKAVVEQGKKAVDAAAESDGVMAQAAAQAAAQEAEHQMVANVDMKFKAAEAESQAKATESLEHLATNANTKAKALTKDRLDSGVKDGEEAVKDLHTASDKLKAAMATSSKAAESAAHMAVNSAKVSIDAVKTMETWHPETAMKQAKEASKESDTANTELKMTNQVTKMAGDTGVRAKASAASSKTESQRAKIEAEAAYKQTQKSKARVEVIRMEIEDAKKTASMAVSEARNAVFKAQDAMKKVGMSGAAAASLAQKRKSQRLLLARK